MAHLAIIRCHMIVFHIVAYFQVLSFQYCSMQCCSAKGMLQYSHQSSEACPLCAANTSQGNCCLQVILKKDGYVNNDAEAAEEAEQLLKPLDSPTHSHTIPELAIVSQVLAPNSIDAAMQFISLRSPHNIAATASSQAHPEAHVGDEDENSDPNQAAALHSHSSQHLELQPLSKKNISMPDEQEVS